MLQNIRRMAAALLVGALLALMLTACGGKTENEAASQLAMTVNGHEVPAGTYAANYLYNKQTMEGLLAQYGIADAWEGDSADGYKEQIEEAARNQTAALYLVPDQFEAAGLSLTEEDEAQVISEDENLESLGFTKELIEQVSRYTIMIEKLDEHYFGENGVMAPEESEVEAYYQEHYFRAKHILISAMDENRQSITDEDTLAQLEQKAQEIYQRAASGEDFDALIEEFGEDPGMETNPNGYLFTEGEMVTEFQEGTEALGMNEISQPVRSSFGWHIIQRLPLEPESRESVYPSIVSALTGMSMSSLLDQWVNEADIQEEPVMSDIQFDTVENYKYDVS